MEDKQMRFLNFDLRFLICRAGDTWLAPVYAVCGCDSAFPGVPHDPKAGSPLMLCPRTPNLVFPAWLGMSEVGQVWRVLPVCVGLWGRRRRAKRGVHGPMSQV